MEKFAKLLLICIFVYWELSSVNAWNIKSSEFHHATLINGMMVKMLTDCYTDSKVVVIHGDSDESTIKSVHETESFSVIIINNSSEVNVAIEELKNVPLFLMTPDSDKQLQGMLLTLKSLPWWNIINPFFILDKSNRKCKNARRILKTAWKMNLIKSFFLCVDSSQTPKIYTYNPYTNYALEPWKKVPSTTKQVDGWTMYTQSHYQGDFCEGLNFDRTKYLNGSIIRVVTDLSNNHTWIPDKDYDETIMEKMLLYKASIAKAMKCALNVTFVFNINDNNWDMREEPQGFYRRLQNGSSDIALFLKTSYTARNFPMSYPIFYSKFHICINNRGYYTPWEKIKSYYGMVTSISLCAILSMTFIVIVLSGKTQRWSFAGFELLRLLVNASLYSRMDTVARRIFFTMIFLYFLIIQATFQGHLSAFLTRNEYRKNVESLEDLKDPRYTIIYVAASAVPLITDALLKRKMAIEPDCGPLIVGNDSRACITDIFYLIEVAFEKKLHVSKKPISLNEYSFLTRNDWPLKERIDLFLMQLERSGFTHRWYDNHFQTVISSQKRITAMSEVKVRPVSLSMLEFAFIILAVGLLLAAISFIFELRIRGFPSRRKQNVRVTRKVVFLRR